MVEMMTASEVSALLDADDRQWRRDTAKLMNRWIERGDGIAIYRNEALDSSNRGRVKFVSFGSNAAQIPTRRVGEANGRWAEPPQRLPDMGSEINWAYQLVGTCFEKLEVGDG